jgi:nucleotide-binding universal stress UspA family protein
LLEELADLDAQRAKLVAHRGRAILEDAQSILTAAGVGTVTTRLRHGDLVEAVAEVEAEASLIVIGKRGEAADFAKGHLGSNLERIVRASHRPVFVASRVMKPIAKVLLAFDGGVSASKAVAHVAANPLFAGLAVHVVTIGQSTAEAQNGLDRARGQLMAAGIETTTSIIVGAPETALGKLVEEASFDLVVMGAYGHSRIRSLIIGSTTTEMIRSCKVPVVLVR